MKKIFLVVTMLFSLSSFAQSTSTGFEVVQDDLIAQTLVYKKSLELKISKKRFSTHKSAAAFCTEQKTSLDKEFNALLLVMSGAAMEDEFLVEAISFEFENTSGIWQWSSKKDMVSLLIDGEGTDIREVPVEELKKSLPVSLPAICSRSLR